MLALAREIFRHYYKMTDMAMPEYFPEKMFKDYEIKTYFMWKAIYENMSEIFQDNQDTIGIRISQITGMDKKSGEALADMLDPTCIKTRNETIIEVYKKPFYAFLQRPMTLRERVQIKLKQWGV